MSNKPKLDRMKLAIYLSRSIIFDIYIPTMPLQVAVSINIATGTHFGLDGRILSNFLLSGFIISSLLLRDSIRLILANRSGVIYLVTASALTSMIFSLTIYGITGYLFEYTTDKNNSTIITVGVLLYAVNVLSVFALRLFEYFNNKQSNI